jgi:hypothetical protein
LTVLPFFFLWWDSVPLLALFFGVSRRFCHNGDCFWRWGMGMVGTQSSAGAKALNLASLNFLPSEPLGVIVDWNLPLLLLSLRPSSCLPPVRLPSALFAAILLSLLERRRLVPPSAPQPCLVPLLPGCDPHLPYCRCLAGLSLPARLPCPHRRDRLLGLLGVVEFSGLVVS